MTIREKIKEWWMMVSTVFAVEVKISLHEFVLSLTIVDKPYVIRLSLLPYWVLSFWHNIWDKDTEVNSKFKFWEWQLAYSANLGTGISFKYTVHEDHQGFYSEIDLLGLEIYMSHIDIRHWDYQEQKYNDIASI